jgi:hypothetical protein
MRDVKRFLPLLLVMSSLLAGCGGGGGGGGSDNGVADKTADEIVADATTAAKNADSVYVHGSGTNEGQELAIDLHLVADQGGAGHIAVSGLSFDVVRIGDTAYFKGDDAFWKQFGGDAAAQLFADKWVKAPATGDLASLASLTDTGELFDGILGSHGTLEKGDETDVDGNPAIAVNDTEQDGTLYVSTEDEPYPLKLETGEESEGSILFEDWNEDYDLEAPEGAIDMSQLQGG